MSRSKGLPPVHPDNWQNQLAEKALEFFEYMSESVVSDVLVSRITDDSSHQYVSFSQLITDVSIEEDAIKLFEKAISLFQDNPFFKVHLGRYYSIKKKLTGISMAIKYTDEGIFCSQNYSRLVRGQFAQMKGVVYSRQVNYLVEQGAELETIIEMAVEGVENFRRAVSIAPDFVDGYIPEVRMMCKVFEYIERKTGNFREYVKSNSAHPLSLMQFPIPLTPLSVFQTAISMLFGALVLPASVAKISHQHRSMKLWNCCTTCKPAEELVEDQLIDRLWS